MDQPTECPALYRRNLRYLAEYVTFRVLVCVLRSLPTRSCASIACTVAFIVHHLVPRCWTRYNVAFDNIQRAFGGRYSVEQIDELIHRMWRHLFRMVAEIVHVPNKMRLYNVSDILVFRNGDRTTRAVCAGRPVLFLGGHFGNWEVAMSTFGWFGFPAGVVARDLDNPYLHAWFQRFRSHTGHCLIPKNGASSDMLAIIERQGNLGLLCDQDSGRKGVFVDFFGHPASTVKSIAILALQHRAVICVGYARRLPDDFVNHRWARYEMGTEEILDPLEFGADIHEMTQRFTAALERAVRRSPEQYFWVHRRWKSQERGSRSISRAA